MFSNYDAENSVFFEFFDKVSEKYKNSLICFVSETLDKEGKFCGFDAFGSGFFIEYLNRKFLVTAKHVLEEAKSRSVGMIIRGPQNAIELHIMNACADVIGSDAAIIRVEDIKEFDNLTGIEYIKIEDAIDKQNLAFGLFLGYPFSINRNKPQFKDVVFNSLCYSASFTDRAISTKDVSNPLLFSINIKRTVAGINREPTSISGPNPYGMSGGPVIGIFGILINKTEDDMTLGLIAQLTGIGVQYIKDEHILVAEDIICVKNLIEIL